MIKRLEKQGLIQQQVQQIRAEKERIISEITSLSFIKKSTPSHANFFLVKVDSSSKRYNQLIERGIVVRNPPKITIVPTPCVLRLVLRKKIMH